MFKPKNLETRSGITFTVSIKCAPYPNIIWQVGVVSVVLTRRPKPKLCLIFLSKDVIRDSDHLQCLVISLHVINITIAEII